VKDDAVFKCEKSLRTNEGGLRELAVLKIATIQRNRESIRVRAARDLAENQIRAWKIGNYQPRAGAFRRQDPFSEKV